MQHLPRLVTFSTLIVLLIVVACTSGVESPPPGLPSDAPAAVEHASTATAAPTPALADQVESPRDAEWVRPSAGGRDPFAWQPPVVVAGLDQEPEVDLDRWRVTGIVSGTSVRSAILVGPAGEAEFPREGETFLSRNVRVREIRDGAVEFVVGKGEGARTVVKRLEGVELANANDEARSVVLPLP